MNNFCKFTLGTHKFKMLFCTQKLKKKNILKSSDKKVQETSPPHTTRLLKPLISIKWIYIINIQFKFIWITLKMDQEGMLLLLVLDLFCKESAGNSALLL